MDIERNERGCVLVPCPECAGFGFGLTGMGSLCKTCGGRGNRAAPYPFCGTPEECAGRGYCNRDIACDN